MSTKDFLPVIILLGIFLGAFSTTSPASLCLPGFPCVHGVCTSGTTCQCNDGWRGVLCTEPVKSTTTDETPVEVGIEIGEENWGSLPTLLTRRVSTTTTTNAELSENQEEVNTDQGGGGEITNEDRECIPGFKCIHGVCIKGTLTCRCEEGWSGAFCQDEVIGTSPGINGTGRPQWQNRTSTEQPNVVGHFKPEDGYGPLADISLRHCANGFECRYGNCSRSSFGCLCEAGWIGVFCHVPCPLNCGEHGACQRHGNNLLNNITSYECECEPLYMGPNCSMRRPDIEEFRDDTLFVYAVSISASMVVLVVIVLVVVLYLLWRRGNITMLKLVLWFQQIEDDDGRLYDAFVSYASMEKDRQFVMECLIPVLEDQMAFTLCIHERDFMPGKYITSNIMDSVRQSRRTLLVISPAFVSRNWCQFEFQAAVAEMIEKKQRILPVIVGDMQQIKQESNIDDTFQRVLNTVTYLQYPGDDASEQELQRFWKRLELSMPKRSKQSSASPPCSPAPTPTSITPLSLDLPSHKHHNEIIFPKSSNKVQGVGEIQIEPEIQSNHDIQYSEANVKSSKNSERKTSGFVAWFRIKIGRRKRPSERSVYAENCSLGPIPHVKGSHNTESNAPNNVGNDGDKNGDDKGEIKQIHIDLSGWTWPTSSPNQDTC